MQREKIHFVTGRLAEPALRNVVAEVAAEAEFDYTIDVLPISVAALMTPEWIARRIQIPEGTSRVLLPGYCEGPLEPIEAAAGIRVERGPRDLRRLPEFFGHRPTCLDYGAHDIEIVAEINNCPQLTLREILARARRYADDGADVIDVGCLPGHTWRGVASTVAALRDEGHRVSIDSMNVEEISRAVAAGAELVLSVNQSTLDAARDWGVEVVAVPEQPATLAGLDQTITVLDAAGVRYRIDPILEPIGFGFAASLGRYLEVRRTYPDAPMLMGIGNLTELTDVDSAGINVLLLGFCQEVGIRSVLTTEVINWARSSVRESALARQLVHYAVRHRVLPKHIEPRLVMLRDPAILEYGQVELDRLADSIRDGNIRIFSEDGEIHLLTAGRHLRARDPFLLMERLIAESGAGLKVSTVDVSHAFYLGYEMCKASIALQLGKQYTQDESLDWGCLTIEEKPHRLRRTRSRKER